ncbi:transmembrane protein, putative [Medicago truncatula]|uniref:Transmembrane protein, putative n=1 Tax=Medicago truncatula TaxID=3880 RepID=G7KN11_MEDTR|nr:transmembrane protein, putative [Medicago truncatula]
MNVILCNSTAKEGSGNNGVIDKYLRDNVLSLLLAGNGTISSSLGWFFWLVFNSS